MKMFGIKCAGFLGIQVGIFGMLLFWYDLSLETNYLAATCEKHARLERASAPRVILVGGSNLAFGVDSARLEKALGREVVNMGLTAGLGIDFMLNEIEPDLKSGDTVVLSLEYDRFSGGYNPLNLRQIVEYRPASFRYMEFRQWNRVLVRGGLSILGGIGRRAIRIHSESSVASNESSAYRRSGFNTWGDLTTHHGTQGAFSSASTTAGEALHADWLPTERVLSRLRTFANKCNQDGVVFSYSCPPQPEGISWAQRETVALILEKLDAVPYLQILDSPEDQSYPDSQFFDTGYHLTREGTQRRTEKLIATLQAILRGPGLEP